MGHVFISYSHSDAEYALEIAQELDRRGFSFWIDTNILPGERWTKEVVDNLNNASALIVIMTPEADRSEWVEREILVAQRQSKPIFPLLLAGDEFPLLITLKYEDVTDGALPSEHFFYRIRKAVDRPIGHSAPEIVLRDREGQPTRILNDTHRQADLKLLYELWESVNTMAVSEVAERVYQRVLTWEFYNRTFVRYMRLRARPEKHFLQPELEEAFSTFDQIVIDFDEHLGREEKLMNVGGEQVYVPNYKLGRATSEEVRIDQEEQHDRTIEMRREFLRQHTELVNTIKWIVPEFTFPDRIYGDE